MMTGGTPMTQESPVNVCDFLRMDDRMTFYGDLDGFGEDVLSVG